MGALLLVSKVMAKLNLTDSAKADYFYKSEIADAEEAIEGLNHNKQLLDLSFNKSIREVDKEIVDAEISLEEAYSDITLEDVKNNAAIKTFKAKFWQNIKNFESILKDRNDFKIAVQKKYKEDAEDIVDQIKKYQLRIEKLSKTVEEV